MRTLFLQCEMGAAGDMLMAALLELCPDRQIVLGKLNALGIPGVTVSAAPSVKCGITGTHVSVAVDGVEECSEDAHEHDHNHEHGHDHSHEHGHDHSHEHEHGHAHSHATLGDIERLVGGLALSEQVRRDVLTVYGLIAEAESFVHGRPVGEIHFHEVGAKDALADIVGVCQLMETLAPEQVLASPIHVGCGQVRCAHGILPVPAPATARILSGVPVYGGAVRGELCTPTGAALLKHFVSRFGEMPVMRVGQIGYGMGSKDFEAANCVRALLGETAEAAGEIAELRCNLDDMTPEAVGFAQERLFEAGALDVYTVPIGMKKNRPGVLLTCMCRMEQRDELLRVMFRHTTTLGVREYVCGRYALRRSERSVETGYGTVRVKASCGWGVHREKPEYEDMARIARENRCSLEEAERLLQID